MKKFALFAVAAAMTLASCSSNTENGFEPAAPDAGLAALQDLEAGVGDSFTDICYSHLPCDAEFTITSLTLTDECSQEYDSYGSDVGELEPGEVYFEVEGEFVVRTSENGWAMLDDPQFVDAEGFTQRVKPSAYCRAEAPYVSWSSTLDAGQKARHFGAWIVPADASHLLLHGKQIKLSSAEQKFVTPDEEAVEVVEEPAAPAPAPAPVVTSQAPAPAPAAPRAPVGFTGAPNGEPQPLVGKVIDYCMSDPIYQRGTTMFTDGTTGWTAECAG